MMLIYICIYIYVYYDIYIIIIIIIIIYQYINNICMPCLTTSCFVPSIPLSAIFFLLSTTLAPRSRASGFDAGDETVILFLEFLEKTGDKGWGFDLKMPGCFTRQTYHTLKCLKQQTWSLIM